MVEDFGKPGEYWIAVDLDGTLAHYDGWKGAEHIGDPILTMVDRVHKWIDEGKKISIFTARASCPDKRHFVCAWLTKHGLGHLEITNIKHPKFKEFWDDRAVCVQENTGQFMRFEEKHQGGAHDDLSFFPEANQDFTPVPKFDVVEKNSAPDLNKDTGEHYRFTYKGIKLDPARIMWLYAREHGMHPMQGAIVKKALCAGNRGHKDMVQDLDDIITAAVRWKEMLIEDMENGDA